MLRLRHWLRPIRQQRRRITAQLEREDSVLASQNQRNWQPQVLPSVTANSPLPPGLPQYYQDQVRALNQSYVQKINEPSFFEKHPYLSGLLGAAGTAAFGSAALPGFAIAATQGRRNRQIVQQNYDTQYNQLLKNAADFAALQEKYAPGAYTRQLLGAGQAQGQVNPNLPLPPQDVAMGSTMLEPVIKGAFSPLNTYNAQQQINRYYQTPEPVQPSQIRVPVPIPGQLQSNQRVAGMGTPVYSAMQEPELAQLQQPQQSKVFALGASASPPFDATQAPLFMPSEIANTTITAFQNAANNAEDNQLQRDKLNLVEIPFNQSRIERNESLNRVDAARVRQLYAQANLLASQGRVAEANVLLSQAKAVTEKAHQGAYGAQANASNALAKLRNAQTAHVGDKTVSPGTFGANTANRSNSQTKAAYQLWQQTGKASGFMDAKGRITPPPPMSPLFQTYGAWVSKNPVAGMFFGAEQTASPGQQVPQSTIQRLKNMYGGGQ